MYKLLSQTVVLWALLVLTVALTVGFQLAAPLVGGVLLDEVGPAQEVQQLLATMTAEQKQAHLWITVLLDILYPLAYGGLFLGLCLRHAGKYAFWLAVPAFLVIPIDLIENIVQVITLLGNENLLAAKALLTPSKFMLFYVAALIALGSLCIRLVMKLFGREH